MRSIWFSVAGGVLVFALAIIGLFFWILDPLELTRPSDQDLLVLFQTHRANFEELRTMALRDVNVRSLVTEPTLGCAFAGGPRDQKYCRLIEGIRDDLEIGIDRFQINFICSGGGFTISPSWMKGITYLPQGPDRIGDVVENLDAQKSRYGVWLKPIEGNWFLIYSRDD